MLNNLDERSRLLKMAEKYKYSLTEDYIKKLKLIGQGNDAYIYKLNNDLLLKIYKTQSSKEVIPTPSLIDFVKTDRPKFFINTNPYEFFTIDEDGVKIPYDEILKLAIRKQEYISNTYLPICPIYINNHFRGCIIKYFKFNLPLSSFSFLNKNLKVQIFWDILKKEEELLKNNCYTTDLYNKINEDNPHNNIIIQLALNKLIPQIIDLDGKSIRYTNKFNENYYKKTLFGLTCLLLEFFYDQDLSDYYEEDDIYKDYYINYFISKNIPSNIVYSLFDHNVSIDNIYNFLDFKRTLKK